MNNRPDLEEVIYGYYGYGEEKELRELRSFADAQLLRDDPPTRRELFDAILDDLASPSGGWNYEEMPSQIAHKLYYSTEKRYRMSTPRALERGLYREIMDDLDEVMDKNPPTQKEKIAQDRAFNKAWANAHSEAYKRAEEMRLLRAKQELEWQEKEEKKKRWIEQQKREEEERRRQPAIRVTQHRTFFFTIILAHDPFWHEGRHIPKHRQNMTKKQIEELPRFRRSFALTKKGAERRAVKMMWRYCKGIELKAFRKDRASRPVFELVRGEAG